MFSYSIYQLKVVTTSSISSMVFDDVAKIFSSGGKIWPAVKDALFSVRAHHNLKLQSGLRKQSTIMVYSHY